MKESYKEGIASHIGPESCAFGRESEGEALTGERAGRVWVQGVGGVGPSQQFELMGESYKNRHEKRA